MARHPKPTVVGGVVASVAASLMLVGCSSSAPEPAPQFAEQSAPAPSEPWAGGPAYTVIVDQAWAEEASAATGIPLTAMLAYASAAIAADNVLPGCGLGWNTLAAIGEVESDHGRHDGSTVGPTGLVEPPIYGVALDGDGVAEIPDTDEGSIDGISDQDRAVGPMQLIPQTWLSWNIDGSGDNVPDPQNIYDSTLAAANYLCHASGDMADPDGWRAGIAAYNAGSDYLQSVATAAERYGSDVAELTR